jgi:hypothetical protein
MTAARPLPGDFLIHRVSHWADVLLVGRDQDHHQLSSHTYQAALTHATRAAARFNVDVWQTENDVLFERVVRYREVDAGGDLCCYATICLCNDDGD